MAIRRKILDDLFDAFTIVGSAQYVSLYDVKGQMTRYSQAAVELFGLPGEYIEDGADDWTNYVHPEDRKRYTSAMADLLSGTANTYNLTYRIALKEGGYGLFRLMGAIIRRDDASNAPELVGGIMINEGLMDNTDGVTVLRNQYGFMSDLRAILELRKKNVIAMLGISRLSEINENFGYAFGNHMLREVAWVIQEYVAGRGTVYRLDGARFAVMSDQMTTTEMSEAYESIRQRLLDGIEVEENRQSLIINGGMLVTEDVRMAEQTVFGSLRFAYRESKVRHHGRLVDFNGTASEKQKASLKLIDVIRDDIIHGCRGFSLVYQPTYRVANDTKVSGAEVLLRWEGKDYGKVLPDVYMPILERDYIFEELGYWILENAMRDGVEFLKQDPDFVIAVNIASVQIEDDYFIEELRRISEETGFALEHFCCELTKDCRQLDVERLKSVAKELTDHGVRLILDDFGTGVASIDFLRDLLPNYIKFAMKYTKEAANSEEDWQIIKHLSELAVTCGTTVCIKGIETQEVYDRIKECKAAQVMQGFLFAEPMDKDEMLKKIGA